MDFVQQTAGFKATISNTDDTFWYIYCRNIIDVEKSFFRQGEYLFAMNVLRNNDSFYVYTFKLTGLQDINRMLDFIETENLYDFEIESIPEAVSAEEYTQELQKYEYRRADPSEFSLPGESG